MSVTSKVAIVEDDELVRAATSSLVRSLGYDVACFESADAFLTSGMAAECACLVSDVSMPGMSGIELRDELLRGGSLLPIIFVTAFASEQIRRMASTGDIAGLLEKPFESAALVALLTQVLPNR